MQFNQASIDRAIVITQYELRGFAHPLGPRIPMPSAKYLAAALANFMIYAAKKTDSDEEIEGYVSYWDSDYGDYLRMCYELSEACNIVQREAIQLIVMEIERQHAQIADAIQSGAPQSRYFLPIETGNPFGNAVLGLHDAFKVEEFKAQKQTAA